jgi:hypothetical protein
MATSSAISGTASLPAHHVEADASSLLCPVDIVSNVGQGDVSSDDVYRRGVEGYSTLSAIAMADDISDEARPI